jgi:predicted NACHT family NTPase
MKSDRCRKLLQRLALAMFTHPQGRQRQVGLRWAAEQLEAEFDHNKENTALERAEYFLRDEMLDSGIIVERSNRLEFWHLSFQEYLAACEIFSKKDKEQIAVLLEQERIFLPDWREVVLLFAGILHKYDEDKINYLVDNILTMPGPATITELSHCPRFDGSGF